MGPSETTRADPDTSPPRPWVEIVSTPRGSISVWTVRAPSLGDLQIARNVHQQSGVNQGALGVVEINSGTGRRDGPMEGSEGGTAQFGLQIHEHQIGDPGPVGKMRKVQSGHLGPAPVHLHDRQRGEDAPGGIHLRRDGGEPVPCRVRCSVPTPRSPDVSVAVNTSSMNQAVCPLASRGISAASSATPPRIKRQLTPIASASRLWSAAAVRMPPA